LLALHYEQCANVFIIHHFDRLKNHGVRRDGKHFTAFAIQDRTNRATNVHIIQKILVTEAATIQE
jgi:hypothetical protein